MSNESMAADPEQIRREISYVAAAWVKLCRATLEECESRTKISRPNLTYQMADPENSRKVKASTLARTAVQVGIRIDDEGQWSLIPVNITWHWPGESDVPRIIKLFELMQEKLSPAKGFSMTRVRIPENKLVVSDRQHLVMQFSDSLGCELTATMIAEDEDTMSRCVETLLSTGFFMEMPEITAPPEFAIQVASGSAPMPQQKFDTSGINFNQWMEFIFKCEIQGIKPQDLAKVTRIDLGGSSPGGGFVPRQEAKQPKSWGF